MEKTSKIYVAGHTGLVGTAIVRELKKQDFTNIVVRTHKELDLLSFDCVSRFFIEEKPEYVFLAAAKVGGIYANMTRPAELLYENLQIQNNVIQNAYLNNVKKLIYLGSSCMYPKNCRQPMREEYLLTGKLEPTNEQYAIAKIAGVKMCESYNLQYGTNYISTIPTNIYGINDNFHPKDCHVIPGLISRIHKAKITNAPFAYIWGTGKPRREFMFSDDLANACVFLMRNYSDRSVVNVGVGSDISIYELGKFICEIVGFRGDLKFDTNMSDGVSRKLLDISKLTKLGWSARTDLKAGLKITYNWYLKNIASDKELISQKQV